MKDNGYLTMSCSIKWFTQHTLTSPATSGINFHSNKWQCFQPEHSQQQREQALAVECKKKINPL